MWKKYRIVDIFEVKNTHNILSSWITENSGSVPYLTATQNNNSVSTFISYDKEMIDEGNSIFIGGKTLVISYQEKDYFSNDSHNLALYFKDKIHRTKPIQLYMVSALYKSLKPLYSWGNSISKQKIQNDFVSFPTLNNKIAFSYMESYIKALEAERIETLEAYLLVSGFKDYQLTQEEEDALEAFDTQEWQEFRMGDLFDRVKTKKLPHKAKELPKEPQGEYSLPALTSSFMNQGLNYYVPKEGATVLQNVISIPSNSDVYRAYFQSQEFTVLSDAYAIDWIGSDKQLRPNDYLFMVPSINKVTDLPIYSYKNKLGGWNVVKDKLIKLPVNEQGEINFDYMATLVQAIKKLAIKDVVLYADKQIEATKEVVQKGSK